MRFRDGCTGVRNGVPSVGAPLYRLKAEFFGTLGHPVRIRVLEPLGEREHAVSEMLGEEGSAVYFRPAAPDVAEPLRVARSILPEVPAGHAELLADLRAAGPGTGEGPAGT
ncbi:ArsR family transcriptional regulator [Streptomyces sp. CB00316]|uniref:transcriptional regulator n=1 Tax=unclassified Streptomyces TaxID=2593676 RepID=UPI00093B25E9|nr:MULTISPECIES: transcriptional regulator [unclassified Streptomyces]MBT2425720.1 transcriptional regulator [Streptomyces sp. ISL-112]OKJ18651.1 ArsR family transcriptional regulator [Streptomyces sp. CB00316]